MAQLPQNDNPLSPGDNVDTKPASTDADPTANASGNALHNAIVNKIEQAVVNGFDENKRVLTEPDIPIVVGIGASAGGLQALNEFLERLPTNTGMAYVIVQHMGAGSTSQLPDLLSKKTQIPVVKIATNMQVKPDHIYVITPGSHLGILHGKLQVFESDAPVQYAIDHFFTALACDRGRHAIGIVLSGGGSDGTIGLKAINAEGGITFAQLEDTAAFGVMPHHAIASGCVDYVLSPSDIAERLAMLSKDIHLRFKVGDTQQFNDDSLSKIFFLLRQHTGHDFSHYKHTTLLRRIRRRMSIHHVRSFDGYIKLLHENKAEIGNLFDDILINVTSFFRDPELFDALRENIFPILHKDRDSNEPIRIWVPGCSTGEEVYSLAIILMEFLGERWIEKSVHIFATDIDRKALAKARAGIFSEASLKDLSQIRKRNFFNKVQGGYQVTKTIRDWCVFAEQDVLRDPPFSRLNMICCRNLLIYMDNTLQKYVLSIFHFALREQGYLVLGVSESTSQGSDWFVPVDSRRKIYERKTTRIKPKYDFEGMTLSGVAGVPKLASAGNVTRNIQKEAENYVLYHYCPSCILVDQYLDIVGFLGNTGQFVEPIPGAVSLKLLKMVHRDLVGEVRAIMHLTLKENAAVKKEGISFVINHEPRSVTLKSVPLQQVEAGERYFLLLFELDRAPRVAKPSLKSRTVDIPLSEKDQRIRELEMQLSALREEMQGFIGEYLSANEALQTANEEVQSANEELQSTNEELESAKEELQSTNEELVTVNDELESRNEELALANNDLNNLLTSINVPMVMLSNDLRIRQFTPSAKPLLNIIDSDIGRPFTDLRPNIDIENLESMLLDVIDQVTPRVIEAKDHNGMWYSLNVRPYKTADHRITGAVLVFLNVSVVRFESQHLRWLADFTRDSCDAVSLVDLNGRFLTWNPVAEKLYGFTEQEALRINLLDLVPEGEKERVSEILRKVVAKETVNASDSVRIAKTGARVNVLMAATGMHDQYGNLYAIAINDRDYGRMPFNIEKVQKFAELFDAGNMMVVALNLNGKIELWNRKVQEKYRYSEKELAGLSFKMLMCEGPDFDFEKWISKLLEEKESDVLNPIRVTKEGGAFFVRSSAMISIRNDRPCKILLFERENMSN